MMFKDFWTELEIAITKMGSKGILKRMLGEQSFCPLFIGIKQPGMCKAFIIQISKQVSPMPEDLEESKGFDFNVMIAGDEVMPGHVSLILSAKNMQYNGVIESISEILYSKICHLKDEAEIIREFLDQVKMLQVFFEKQDVDGLSEDAQKGLYGELVFLEKYLLKNEGSEETALNSWTGPQKRQHDFQFGSLGIEVKTTSSKVHQRLKISSEQQLDETVIGKLYLYYLSVSLIQNHAETLSAIIDRVRNKISYSKKALSLFNNGLLIRGYLDNHREKYDYMGYAIRDAKFFHIQSDFPRIKELDLRKGVGDVSYSVSVVECLKYEIIDSNVSEELQGLLL